jgi:hypothetical protein
MKSAALGIRMHSGWGVLVAVSGDADSVEVIDRRRIVTIGDVTIGDVQEADPRIPGAKQPYHFAAGLGFPKLGLPKLVLPKLGLREAERYLTNCAAISDRMAFAAIGEVVRELDGRHYRIVGSAVLVASGRPLPSLAKILASHPLIHTAEGEFFRNAVRRACERWNISVAAIPERELEERAETAFGKAASRVQCRIASLGGSIGPPWTKDHKAAALAAVVILAGEGTMASTRAAQKNGPRRKS